MEMLKSKTVTVAVAMKHFMSLSIIKTTPNFLYTKKTEVLGPLRVVHLRSVGMLLPISVTCIQQPSHVEHHRTFIVDTEALKSTEDLKCDGCGCWLNNNDKKFCFVVDKGGNVSRDISKEMNGPAVVCTFKREYFCLKDGDSE